MKVCGLLFVTSACLSAFPAFAATSPPAVDLASLQSWVQDTLELSENLDAGVRERIQELINAAVEQITGSEDIVLRTVWQELLRFGSTLQANFSAWQRLEAFDYKKQVNGQTLMVDDPIARRALSEAVLQCSSLEMLAQKQVAGIQQSFEAALREQGASNDRRKLEAKYGPMRKFLRELATYMVALQGQTELIHRTKMLEAAVSQGDMAASALLAMLNEQHHKFNDALERRFSEVLAAAQKCQELGLLLDGVVAFMLALNEL